MLQFLVRRLIVALLVAATVMTLAFILTRLSGDLAISIAGPSPSVSSSLGAGVGKRPVGRLCAGGG